MTARAWWVTTQGVPGEAPFISAEHRALGVDIEVDYGSEV